MAAAASTDEWVNVGVGNTGGSLKGCAPSPTTKRRERKTFPVDFTFVSWDDVRRQKFNPQGGASITDSWLVQMRKTLESSTPRVADTRCRIGRVANWSDMTLDIPFDSIPIMVGNQKKNHGALYSVTLTYFLEHLDEFTNITVDGKFVLDRDTHLAASPQTNLMESIDGEEVQFIPVMHHYQYDERDPGQLVIVASAGGTSVHLCNERNKELPFHEDGRAFNFSAETLSGFRDKMGDSGLTETSGTMNAFEQYKNTIFVFMFDLETSRKEEIVFEQGIPECATVMRSLGPSPSCYRSVSHAKYQSAIIGKGDPRGEFSDDEITVKRLTTASGRVMIERFQIGGLFGPDTWTDEMQVAMQQWSDDMYNSGGAVGSLPFSCNERPTQVTLTEQELKESIQQAQQMLKAQQNNAFSVQQLLTGAAGATSTSITSVAVDDEH